MQLAIILIVVALIIVRLGLSRYRQATSAKVPVEVVNKKPLSPLLRKLYTVWMFFVVNMRRLFRDRLALFFTFLFPLIFLFVFGALSHSNKLTLRVAVINQSQTVYARQFEDLLSKDVSLQINKQATTEAQANASMSRGEIDAIVLLPSSFGKVVQHMPTGQAVIQYSGSNSQAAQTLTSILQAQVQAINTKLVNNHYPFKVISKESNAHSLSTFDYTFTGLLGFAILGAGIFGPMNVFPELKKMGILRRLHTTPLRVWQYFLANMMGNAVTGLLSVAVLIIVAILVFHLHVVGNYLELAVFLIFGIVMILGIGLALGGWAKNERQVAPLGNIIVFPMIFLTGVFFPRYLMPQWLQQITNYVPLTPVIDGARMIATEGKSLVDLGPQLAVMAVWTIIIYAIAFRVFRWE